MEAGISIIIGGLITILTAIFVEYLRRPKLWFAIEDPPLDFPPEKRTRRHLRLVLRNEPLPVGARWMQRSAALQCRGEITFHDANGQNVFGKRAMVVRWASTPEPLASRLFRPPDFTTIQYVIQDFSRAFAESRVDTYPDDAQKLDIAARFDDDEHCFGWNNDAYSYAGGRNPDWKLPPGRRYLVKVVITSSGQKCIGRFSLLNAALWTDCLLSELLPEDRGKI